ncbi:MAG: hypothetical protein ACI9UV_000789 [Algoriphagus sp.]|jgi:hypothetical protein
MQLSIILEWENAVRSELDRTEKLLVEILTQTFERSEIFELLILHNSEMVTSEFIFNFISDTILKNNLRNKGELRLIDVKDAHYFQLKNQGVIEAKGDLVLILDSDIIPKSDWLNELLSSHSKNQESITAGFTVIDYSDFIGKCFSLCWFFPIPNDRTDTVGVDMIFSNNFICSRKLLLENPYPNMEEGITRGADLLLWKMLKEKEIKLYLCFAANATHPSPNGFFHFVKRGLAEGRDDYFRLFLSDLNSKTPTISFIKIWGKKSQLVFKKVFRYHLKVDSPSWQIPFIIVTMLSYYGFYLMGGVSSMLIPKFAKSSWQI